MDAHHEDRRSALPGRRDYDQVSMQHYLERMVLEIDRRLANLDVSIERLTEKQERFVTIDYYDERHDSLVERVGRGEQRYANLQGRSIALAFLGAVLISALSGYIGHVI